MILNPLLKLNTEVYMSNIDKDRSIHERMSNEEALELVKNCHECEVCFDCKFNTEAMCGCAKLDIIITRLFYDKIMLILEDIIEEDNKNKI